MRPRTPPLALLGLVLCIAGALLPWSVSGDFISYWRPGLRLYPGFADNGGLLVILLAVTSTGLLLARRSTIKPAFPLAISALLLAVTLLHGLGILLTSAVEGPITGRTTLQVGLPILTLGASILIVASVGAKEGSAA